MGKKDVEYWPLVIKQWSSTTGGIGNIITAKSSSSLKRKDQKSAWRLTHASVAMCSSAADREMEAEICMQVLTALKQKACLTLYAAKDRDGDTPLHSVVKTGDVDRLNILLIHLPTKLLRDILEMTNKLGQAPLKVAFDQEEWDILEVLLNYCIKNELCSNLTGVGENLPASKTLLHHAMDKGCSQFVEMYFDVTTRNEYGKPGLLVYDEYGRTPWFYLMNHKDSKLLGSILCTLEKHNVGVNELITDKFSRSTMLHLAYRKKHEESIELLKAAGADPRKEDTRSLRADQRDHLIGSSQKRSHAKCQEPEGTASLSPRSTKPEVIDYWPRLIWQWIKSGGIGNIITAKSRNTLKQKDKKNAWRLTHASVAMRSSDREMDAEICMQVLTALKQRNCLALYAAKDRDGDTPLHSVVKTGDVDRLNILLDHLPPELLRDILEVPNKLGQTPLKVSFDQEEWDILEVLLNYCISNGLCSNLTGVGENLPASKTLLHHAMDKGCSQFVEMYFDLTTEYGKHGRLVYDEYGRTPWFYLMNHKDSKFLRSILLTLKKHNVDVNELITDKFSRSTMLHLAYRKKHQECIKLLIEAGADPGKKDTRSLRANQRAHLIGISQKRAREKCRELVAQDQQQETSEEAVEEATREGIEQFPNEHQLAVCTSSTPKDSKLFGSWVLQSGVPFLESTEEVMPPSIRPFSSVSAINMCMLPLVEDESRPST